jgi:hypothetical protein
LGESFQENLLRRVFNLAALAKKFGGDPEHSRAVAANYFSKGGLVFCLRLVRQLEVRGLFVAVRQKRSSHRLRQAGR